ncbi:MAG: Cupin domain [archaeon]|jgi:quercetin dioxygenase-like cupin family protein
MKEISNAGELIADNWENMEVYHMNEEQKEKLLNNKILEQEYIMFPKGSVWEEHAHTRPQLLLVIAGKLTHVVDRKEFVQEANDVLIVPKNIPHRAFASKNKPLLVYVFHKK